MRLTELLKVWFGVAELSAGLALGLAICAMHPDQTLSGGAGARMQAVDVLYNDHKIYTAIWDVR